MTDVNPCSDLFLAALSSCRGVRRARRGGAPVAQARRGASAALPGARGFTLLEVLIAVVIAGILLVTVYGSVTQTLRSKEIAEERAELFASGRDAVLRMADEIEAALPPSAGDRILFRGESGMGTAPTGSIEFVAMNRGRYGASRVRPGQVYISYSLDPIPKQRDLFALRREEHLFAALLAAADGVEFGSPDEEETGPTAVASYLLDCPDLPGEIRLPGNCVRVAGLRFRYYDDLNAAWLESWDTTQEDVYPRLPAAVEITLFLEDENGVIDEFMTIVDLPLARGQPTPRPGEVGQAEDEETDEEE